MDKTCSVCKSPVSKRNRSGLCRSCSTKQAWSRPEVRAKFVIAAENREVTEDARRNTGRKISALLKEQYTSGARRSWNKGLTKEADSRVANIANHNKGRKCSEELKHKLSVKHKGKFPKQLADYWSNPENCLEKSRLMRLLWFSEPERFVPCSRRGILWTEEQKEKLRRGAANTLFGYPKEFLRLREQVKERDGLQCQLCFTPFDLVIHHIDGDKRNCELLNLVTLCRKCHCHVNYDRAFWEDYFTHREKDNRKLYCGLDIKFGQVDAVYLDEFGGFVACFTIRYKHFDDTKRIREFVYRLSLNIAALRPTQVIIEEPIYIQNPLITLKLCETFGVCKVFCIQKFIPVISISNKTWKKEVCGSGGVKKEKIAEFAINTWGSTQLTTQDFADAACIALYGVKMFGGEVKNAISFLTE